MKKLSQAFSQWLFTIFLLAGVQFTAASQTATHLHFDGVDDFVNLPTSPLFDFGTGDFTTEAWIKTSSTNTQIVLGASGSGDFWLGTTSGNAAFSITGTMLAGATAINDNQWHHIAGLRQSGTIYIYVDGVLDGSQANNLSFTTAGQPLTLGRFNGGYGGYYFTGEIDEVRIWNAAQTAGNIAARRNNELLGNETGLLAYYKFNQGIAAGNNTAITTLTNSTANSLNGAITNFSLTGSTSNFLSGSPVTAPQGTHLHFDGVNDMVHCGTAFNTTFSSLNTVTVEAWVKPETNAGLGTIAGNYSYPTNNAFMQFLLRRDGTSYIFWMRNSTNTGFVNVVASNAVVLNTWQHVVGVRNGDQLMIYVNGALVNTATGMGTQNFPANTGNEFTIGGNAVIPSPEFFKGSIDEVRVWTSAVAATEIVRRKNCELQGNEPGLYAYYKFNQGLPAGTNTTVTTLTNSTAIAGLDGILTNFALTGTTSNWLSASPVTTGSAIPSAPAAAAQSFCGSGTVSNLIPVPSATINWYNAATGGTALAGTAAVTTGTYYVAAVNANGCESNRTSVTITINSLPAAPSVAPQSFCGSGTVADFVPAPSATIKWYNVPTGGTALSSFSALATGTYYVANSSGPGCESPRTAVSVIINSMPNISYAGVPATFCSGIPIIPLSVTNTGGAGTNSDGYNVSTFAGSGIGGFVNGIATAAQFNYPSGVATDAVGNVYVAEGANNSIRKITPAGVVTTFAGSGVAGFADGTGTAAQFDNPYGVAADAAGNVYVADQGNHSIRKISPAGVVTTLAGSGVAGFADGTGTAAQFNSPIAVATDAAGYIYVADQSNHSIRKITPAGAVTTLAGNGVAGFAEGMGTTAMFNYPVGIATDTASNIYVSDQGNERIRKITPAGIVSTFAGSGVTGYTDGPGTTAQFSSPFGLTSDTPGNIYVADYTNRRIRKITASGVVTTIAGNGATGFADGPGLAAEFSNPNGLAMDAAGNLFTGDQSNHRIRKIVNNPYNITPELPMGLSFNNTTGEISGTPSVVTGNTTYTINTGNNCGNNSTVISFAVGNSPSLAAANTTQTLPVTGITYFSNGCTDNLIAKVNPTGASPISGNTTAKVWIESIQNPQFVNRHYEITPAANAATATGQITLYFTQQEFDDFNAVNTVDLPAGAADATGKANLLIEKRSGTSSDGTGLPSAYTGSVVTIDPADADIIWNSAQSRWEISFDVTGFSGFFVKTLNGLLPLNLLSFNGSKLNNNNVLLQWQTTHEINSNRFEIEVSSNGNSFAKLGTVAAKNTSSINSYQFTDNSSWASDTRYYRLKMIDNNGSFKYSTVIKMNTKQMDGISIYPNPVTNAFVLNVNNSSVLNTTAKITDMSGSTVMVFTVTSRYQNIDISNFAKGMYMLRFADGSSVKLIKN